VGPVALSGTYFYFPLAYGGGRVFVNDFDGTLRAFNAATGAQEWSTTTSYFSGEPVVSQGEVWVQGSGSVYGLSAKTGAIEAQTGEGSFSGVPAFSGTTGFFASGSMVSALNVANRASGAEDLSSAQLRFQCAATSCFGSNGTTAGGRRRRWRRG
jgi:outer membrane protein assembly factor BamB